MFIADMTWPAVKALNRNIPVVIPIAAVEQHGHHLPVSTDSLLLAEVVRRAEGELGVTARSSRRSSGSEIPTTT